MLPSSSWKAENEHHKQPKPTCLQITCPKTLQTLRRTAHQSLGAFCRHAACLVCFGDHVLDQYCVTMLWNFLGMCLEFVFVLFFPRLVFHIANSIEITSHLCQVSRTQCGTMLRGCTLSCKWCHCHTKFGETKHQHVSDQLACHKIWKQFLFIQIWNMK